MDQPESGFTAFPNHFLDKVMRKADGVEWKVICTVIRDTIGWQRCEADIPIKRFEEMTGAKRSRLFEAITAACKRGAIKRPEQRAFRFRPLPKTNLQPVPKHEKPRIDQGRLQFSSQSETSIETQSENRTLDHSGNPIIGLSQSENRTLPLLVKKDLNTHSECVSKFSREERIEYMKNHSLGYGWLSKSEDGRFDFIIELERSESEQKAQAQEERVTIHERLRREGVI